MQVLDTQLHGPAAIMMRLYCVVANALQCVIMD
jgi:hypothetical protein